ncbi:uncharacterized protein METZ01_LOCUS417911, partial [marine metagenome]
MTKSREESGTLVRLASELLTIGCGKRPGYEPRYIRRGRRIQAVSINFVSTVRGAVAFCG